MYVFPNCQAVVLWQNGRIRLNPEQQWRADDPFVLARPELFDTDPRNPSGTSDAPVERMTAAPGEKRTTPARPRPSRAKPKGAEDK